MTPLHLNILLHYYSCTDEFDQVNTNETRQDYAYQLAKKGYLYTPMEGSVFEITGAGKKVIDKILAYAEEIT